MTKAGFNDAVKSGMIFHKGEKKLMSSKNFKYAHDIDNILPNKPGIYCIRIKNISQLPLIFMQILIKKDYDILYIGIASKSLYKRLLLQELRAKGHGSFFRSIGAILGFTPSRGSLARKKNKRNFKFTQIDEKRIIDWINANLLVSWIEEDFSLDEFETYLIKKYRPLLNISKNLTISEELRMARANCVKIACRE
ncbi:GIY-YIG nuclease family protein [Niabella insulamsoli]|uniref:GIY-YIG nuclease family protein n=1 Tax=Niabella insulamsoli TaxID=3144874 RepID=UPI0031FD74A6